MKVLNKLVSDKETYIDCLEKELCKMGISYVKVDNEIHFSETILRLYTYEELIDGFRLMLIEKSEQKRKEHIELMSSILDIGRMYDINRHLDIYCHVEQDIIKHQKKYQKRTKNDYKKESQIANQKLKRYKGN